MKTYSLGLQNNVVSVYDKTKTTIAGKVYQKTINSQTVLGAPLSKFIDVFTDTLGTLIPGMMFLSPNGRLYVLMSAPVTGVANQIACYDFDLATGVATYRGKIAFSISAQTVATVRQFKVDDSNTSNIKIFYTCISTGVLTGGLYMLNKVALTDFVPAGFPTIYTAISNDVKGVYTLQAPLESGGANLLTTVTGLSVPFSSANAAINTKVFVHNGVAATHQYYVFDYSVAPAITSMGTATSSSNTTGAGAIFTMAGNTLAIGDPVIVTANVPTPLVLTSAVTAQTVYYVSSANFTLGTSFSLAASAAVLGTAINITSVQASTVFIRANGQSTTQFVAKTGNLPALTGVLLLTNSENDAMPSHTANSGFDCVFFTTSTTMYMGKYADLWSTQSGTTNGTINVTGLTSTTGLTVGQTVFGTGIPASATIATIVSSTAITLSVAATTSQTQTLTFGAILWAGLVNANVLGTGLDYLSPPVPVNAVYSNECDAAIFSNTGIYSYVKKFINSQILAQVGVASNTYLEAQTYPTNQFSLQTISSIEQRNGWLLASCLTAPQRGIVAMHFASDALFASSYIVSPVLQVSDSDLKSLCTIEQLFDYTSSAVFQYRTAASAASSVFNSATTGWTTLASASDLTLISNLGFVQFRVMFSMSTAPGYGPSITTPTQIADLLLSTQPESEISDYWDYSQINSASGVPTRAAFKLRQAYTASVPTIYFRAHDESGNQVTSGNTVTNSSNFEYSTDQGATWLPLGTVPNTVGTHIRYTWTTPPGVNVRVSIRES